ncbi:MAG: hypothetical protein JXN64_03095 [Spirochaetes bacterium]|nr:hypothetical protein [Spirochaetota bacterium]
MDIDNYKTEKKLRAIMYTVIGYTEKNGYWRKPKPVKKQHEKGKVQCVKCMEYFEKEFTIQGKNRKHYCIECEKTVIPLKSYN